MKPQLRKIIFFIVLAALVLEQASFFAPSKAEAAVNERINYQGKLTDSSDAAVTDGAYRMYFRLYTTETSATTTAIWEEDRSTVTGDQITITSGLFSVMLGSSTALSGVNFNQTLYLGVEVCGISSGAKSCDGEMTPRKMIGAVPAAFETSRISGLNSSQFLRSDAINSTSTASAFLRITQSGAGDIANFVGQNSATVFSILSGGNVGVGTSSPYARLSVVGQTVAEYFTATSTTATSTMPRLAVTHGLSTPLTLNSVPFIGDGGMLSEHTGYFTFSSSTGLTVQNGIDVSTSHDSYSHFGNSSSGSQGLAPSDTTDRLISVKNVTGTSGTRRALGVSTRFDGASSNSGFNWGFQSLARHTGLGALTASTEAGGISGGQVGINFGVEDLGITTLATGLSILSERASSPDSIIITELIGLQIEGGSLSTTNITDYSGIRIKSLTDATITNHYGLRVDDIGVGTNRYSIYTGTAKSYFGGNVGIGTTTPYSKLTVWGASTGAAKIFELVNSASTTVFSVAENGTTNIGAATAGNIIFNTSTSGNTVLLGIGTSTPDADVTIVSNQASSNTYVFTIATTTSAGVINRRFTVDSDGDIAYDGTASTPADYAEAFGVVGLKKEYEPGDIVITSNTHPGKVQKSDKPYQASIAGVYSTKPGILGTLAKDVTAYRIEDENDIPVGIMGRVPTKVSTENGEIKAGDYITTSSQSGIGMKATSPGKIVGVALEDFNDKEVGKIMVFLNDTFYFGEEGLDLVSRISNIEALLGISSGDQNSFLKILESIGIKIQNSVAYIKGIVTESLTVGSSEKPVGITIYDESTKEPYCLSIKKGKITTIEGECKEFKEPIKIDVGGGSGSGSASSTVEILPESGDNLESLEGKKIDENAEQNDEEELENSESEEDNNEEEENNDGDSGDTSEVNNDEGDI